MQPRCGSLCKMPTCPIPNSTTIAISSVHRVLELRFRVFVDYLLVFNVEFTPTTKLTAESNLTVRIMQVLYQSITALINAVTYIWKHVNT